MVEPKGGHRTVDLLLNTPLIVLYCIVANRVKTRIYFIAVIDGVFCLHVHVTHVIAYIDIKGSEEVRA